VYIEKFRKLLFAKSKQIPISPVRKSGINCFKAIAKEISVPISLPYSKDKNSS